MNPLVEFLAGGGGLGYRQRKQKEDQEAEMARLFKEQQQKNMQLQQQAYELQIAQAKREADEYGKPQTQRIERNGQIWEIDVDSSGKSIGQPRLLGAESPPTAPSVVGAGGGMPGIPVPPMRPTGATPGTFPGPTSRGTPGFNPNPTSGSPSFNAPPQWNPNPNEIALISELSPEDQERIYSLNPTQRAQLLTKANIAKRTRLANEAEAGRTRAAEEKESGLSEAQKQIDKKFAEDYLAWKARGGMADVEKNLAQLREASTTLGGDKNVTGGMYGIIPDKVLAMWNPEAIDTKEKVSEVVQRNLRLILGAQFTEKEGQQLINRAYNDALDESVNKARVDRLMAQIQAAAESRDSAAKYYEQNGTLKGWKGSDFNMDTLKKANEWDGQGPLQIGMTYNGYIYKGGDKNDENNWVKE